MKKISVLILLAMVTLYSPETRAQTEQNPKAGDEKVYEGKDVDSKVKILSMPDPVYTFQASREHVVGVVRLRAVFAASGEIKNIQVVNGLPAGLTENAIEVARKIKFTPAMKDGHPVSQQTLLVYTFELIERVIHGQRFPKLFYDESCRDYFNIASENMVFFTSEKEAKKAGYKKSKTCP